MKRKQHIDRLIEWQNKGPPYSSVFIGNLPMPLETILIPESTERECGIVIDREKGPHSRGVVFYMDPLVDILIHYFPKDPECSNIRAISLEKERMLATIRALAKEIGFKPEMFPRNSTVEMFDQCVRREEESYGRLMSVTPGSERQFFFGGRYGEFLEEYKGITSGEAKRRVHEKFGVQF